MFRRQKVNKKLSADELKSKLYAHFDKSGSLNQIRTQIRSQLASELFKMAPASTGVSEHKTIDLGNTLLPLQVCNWLVYDHLIRQGYQYTLSTFVSETNLPYPEKLLAVGDILALVGLDNSSLEYKRISDLYSTNNEKDGLHSLLLAIIKCVIFITDKDNQQIENVTNSTFETGIKDKLPSRSEKYVHQTEPDVLLGNLGEKNSGIKVLHKTISPESSFLDQLQSIKEERDKEIQNLRHKLVQEIERLHLQEQSFYEEREQERREIRKERDLLFSGREKLKDDNDLFLKEQENKLEKKIREIEEIHIANLHVKDKEIAALKNELKEKEKKLRNMESELFIHKGEFDALKREMDEVNRMYKSIHEKYNTLLDENTNLVRKFESMSDYNILKDELVAKGREISNLQQEIENLHRSAERNKNAYTETVTSLELKLKATEPKLQHLQKELNQTRNLYDMEKAKWHRDSLTSNGLYKTVMQKCEQHDQDIHELHQFTHLLSYQLTSGNMNQKPKSEICDPSRTVPKVAFLSSKKNQILKSDKNNPISISQQYREKALNFTSEYKSSFNKLQQEMDEGFDKYSLISHTSFDNKMPIIKPSFSQNSHAFTHNMKFHQPLFSKNISNTPFRFHLDTSNSLMTLGNLNLKSGDSTVPSFKNSNNSSQLSKTLPTPIQSIYDSTKTFIADSSNVTTIEPKNIYADLFPSQSEQIIETSDILEPSSSMNKMYDKHEEENLQNSSFLTSRTDQKKSAKIKTTVSSSSETILIGLTENPLKNVPPTETISTGSTENTFKDVCTTETGVIETTRNFPATTGMSLERSFLLPTTSKEFSFQSTDYNNVEQSVGTIRKNSKDPALPQISTGITASTDSFKQNEAAPIIVDLDAAWRRKTSLASVNPPLLQSSNPLVFANITPGETISKGETKQNTSISNHPDVMSSNNEQTTTKLDTETLSNLKTTEDMSSSITADQNIMKNSKPYKDLNKNQTKFSQAEAVAEFANKSELEKAAESQDNTHSVSLMDVIDTDEVRKKRKTYYENQSAIKQIPEDSLSELSEVHMSCGSEQEVEKESDNW